MRRPFTAEKIEFFQKKSVYLSLNLIWNRSLYFFTPLLYTHSQCRFSGSTDLAQRPKSSVKKLVEISLCIYHRTKQQQQLARRNRRNSNNNDKTDKFETRDRPWMRLFAASLFLLFPLQNLTFWNSPLRL